ncbi:4a-hydroxytetrahydrobiopterin dehydratase [Pelagibacteraceae bacterium]|nr:4a-hydroxytetrahydrobiopterin dehydratase [Pelagibacteraceae bacterium]
MENNNLSQGVCEPCSGNTPKLNFEEISKYLSQLNDWTVNDNQEMIFKKFKFNNFTKALNFTNKVGDLAEKEGHHPDISIGWGYCLVMVHTHAIKGLSVNDFILASKIDLI